MEQEIISMYEKNFTIVEICDKYLISFGKLYRILDKYNIPKNKRYKIIRKTKIDYVKITDLYNSGDNISDIQLWNTSASLLALSHSYNLR